MTSCLIISNPTHVSWVFVCVFVIIVCFLLDFDFMREIISKFWTSDLILVNFWLIEVRFKLRIKPRLLWIKICLWFVAPEPHFKTYLGWLRLSRRAFLYQMLKLICITSAFKVDICEVSGTFTTFVFSNDIIILFFIPTTSSERWVLAIIVNVLWTQV